MGGAIQHGGKGEGQFSMEEKGETQFSMEEKGGGAIEHLGDREVLKVPYDQIIFLH